MDRCKDRWKDGWDGLYYLFEQCNLVGWFIFILHRESQSMQ